MREFCGNLREFCGNLRALCGQNGYGFSAPHNFGMPLHVLTNLRASFSRLPLQTFVYSVKGREHWNSLFLGVLGVSGFCGKKCYDFPNIQSKAETTFFFQEDEGPGSEILHYAIYQQGNILNIHFSKWHT